MNEASFERMATASTCMGEAISDKPHSPEVIGVAMRELVALPEVRRLIDSPIGNVVFGRLAYLAGSADGSPPPLAELVDFYDVLIDAAGKLLVGLTSESGSADGSAEGVVDRLGKFFGRFVGASMDMAAVAGDEGDADGAWIPTIEEGAAERLTASLAVVVNGIWQVRAMRGPGADLTRSVAVSASLGSMHSVLTDGVAKAMEIGRVLSQGQPAAEDDETPGVPVRCLKPAYDTMRAVGLLASRLIGDPVDEDAVTKALTDSHSAVLGCASAAMFSLPTAERQAAALIVLNKARLASAAVDAAGAILTLAASRVADADGRARLVEWFNTRAQTVTDAVTERLDQVFAEEQAAAAAAGV